MRILGLDVGSKTIGMAVSDELELVANTLATLQRKGMEQDLRNLAAVIAEQEVGAIVVGLPKNMNGSLGPSAQMVLELVEELKRTVAQPVVTWDERLSTVAAEKALLEADMSRKKRKKVIDQVAAVLILQGYLDSRVHLKNRS
jgi:putative Holliday junction resolvase